MLALCGQKPTERGYMSITMTPLHHILDKMLAFIAIASEQSNEHLEEVPNRLLLDALNVKSNTIPVRALNILSRKGLSNGLELDVLNQVNNQSGQAKTLLLKMLAQEDFNAKNSSHQKFIQVLNETLSNEEDVTTAVRVAQQLDHMELTKAEFTQAAQQICHIKNIWNADDQHLWTGLKNDLVRQAESSGYFIAANSICH